MPRKKINMDDVSNLQVISLNPNAKGPKKHKKKKHDISKWAKAWKKMGHTGKLPKKGTDLYTQLKSVVSSMK